MQLNDTSRDELRASIKGLSDSLTRIDGERDFINEEIGALAEKFELEKKYIRKLMTAYHRQTFRKEADEFDEFETLYTEVFPDKD